MNQLSVFDAHCDTIFRCWRECEELTCNTGAVSLDRVCKAFDHYCQIFALWTAEGYTGGSSVEDAYRALLRCFRGQMARNRDRIVQCRCGEEVTRAHQQGKAAAFLSIEGAELLGCDPERLDEAAAEGVVAINLTWNHANVLSGSHADQPRRGLSELGRRFVARMEDLHILIDVSHLSEAGFWDVMEQARRPILASHSNARAVCEHTRNLTDGQITAIIKGQGVIGLNFYRAFVGAGENLDAVRAHLEHMLALGGAKSVAIGGDWDGCETIGQLPAITDLRQLYEHLLRHNYPEMILRDLFYNNLMRVVKQR